jgi:hypothetical protein
MALTEEETSWIEKRKQELLKKNKNAVQTIDRMSEHNPDLAAEEMRLSDETGIPVEAVQYDIDAARKRLKINDLDGLAERSPSTAQYFEDPANAAVSHDDVGNFEKIEAMVKKTEVSALDVALTFPAGMVEQAGMGVSGIGHLYDVYSRAVNNMFHTREVENYLFGEINPDVTRAVRAVTDIGGSLKFTGGKVKQGGGRLDLTNEERSSLSYWENVGVDITKGTGQVVGQILTGLFAGPSAGIANLLGQGVDQAAERQIDSGTLGQSGLTDAGLVMGGIITAGTEKIGLDQLVNRIPPKLKNAIFRNVTDVLLAGGIEAFQEIIEGVLHGVNEMVTSNPEAEIIEGLDREGLAAGGTGIITRAIINMITPGKGYSDPTFNASMRDAHLRLTSEVGQSYLDERISYAQSSKTNERDKKRFAEWIEDIDPEEYVYIRPEALSEIQDLPDYVVEQIDGTGASVSIPMSKFLTDIVKNEDMLEQMRPHLTIREDHTSQFDMVEGSVSQGLSQMLENAQKDQTALTEADEIYEQVKDQLVGTMRQGESTARMSAQLLPAMIVTQQANLAARGIDVSVKKLYEDMGLKIIGPAVEVPGRANVMSQDIYEYEAYETPWGQNEDGTDIAERDAGGFDIANIKRPDGAIGTQGVTEESISDLLRNIAGMDVTDGMTMKEMVEAFKANPEAQQKLRDFTSENPLEIDTLPDGTYHLEDGHHRAFLLDQIGDTTVSATVDGKPTSPPRSEPLTQDGGETVGGFPVQRVGYKRARIDDLIVEYESKERDDETQAWVVMIDPRQFIPASTPDEWQRLYLSTELFDLDPAKLTRMVYPKGHIKQGQEIESPYLEIEPTENGGWEIVAHQGRHRMAAMGMAGYTQVPLVISMPGATNKIRQEMPEDLLDDIFELQGQYSEDTGVTGTSINISNPIALTQNNREMLSREYGVGADNRMLMQKEQDFGDLEFSDTIEQDGQQYEATISAQKLWKVHQERLSMVEALRKCLN